MQFLRCGIRTISPLRSDVLKSLDQKPHLAISRILKTCQLENHDCRSIQTFSTMESVKDRVVLITGASSGIGAATAEEFAKYGSRVVLTGRNFENLNKTAELCCAQGLDKDKILSVAGDLAIKEDIQRIVDTAISTFGTIHILVNNAGITSDCNVKTLSLEELDKVYKTNLRAPVHLTKLLIPYLKENRGSVVNVSSIHDSRPQPNVVAYSLMKAALSMFTQCLALELAPDGIRVNNVSPGTIRTPIHERGERLKEGGMEEYYRIKSSIYPLGRVGEPEEVARSIVFLASDASSFTSGASLVTDGAISLTASYSVK